jgi:hypothetical protein
MSTSSVGNTSPKKAPASAGESGTHSATTTGTAPHQQEAPPKLENPGQGDKFSKTTINPYSSGNP